MTNGVKIGDCVHIIGTYARGVVTAIDDHPFEYANIEIENVLPIGIKRDWYSCRNAEVVQNNLAIMKRRKR